MSPSIASAVPRSLSELCSPFTILTRYGAHTSLSATMRL